MKPKSATIRRTGSRLIAAAVAALVCCSAAWANGQLYKQTLQSTAWVLAKKSDGPSSGTGILIDVEKRLVITSAHVVGDSRMAVIFFPELEQDQPHVERKHYLDNAKRLGTRGQVIAVDRKRDLALVQLERVPKQAQAIALAENSITPGEMVHSVGNPGATEALWVYTSGTVGAVYRKQFRTGAGEHDFKVVQTTSPINSGDSGGPVVNSQGQLVAVVQAMASNARLVSYFVDISEVKAFLSSPWKPAPLPVKEVLDLTELTYTEHSSGHYQVEVGEGDKSKQTVFVTKDVEYYERADVRKIWALAQTTSEAPSLAVTMKLLEQNARTKLGSWAVEQTKEGSYLFIYCVKLDATASPDALKSTLSYVATLTESMKQELSAKPQAATANSDFSSWIGK